MPILNNPPDPYPKTPKLRCPPGACDAHHHLFGPKEKYPFSPDTPSISDDALPEHHIALQDKLGLTRGVIVNSAAYGHDYSHVADTLARFPGRFRGIALPPEDMSETEFARLTRLGVRGLRFFSDKRGTHQPKISPSLATRAFEHGWHVQFFPATGDIVDYEKRLLDLPNTIVLDHFAAVPSADGTDQPAFKTLLRMLDTGRVWIKLSGPMRISTYEPPYPDVTPLARALVAHAPERLVWGTDWPHVNMNERVMPNDGDLLDLMLDWVPDEAVRNRILADNPCALYGFPKA